MEGHSKDMDLNERDVWVYKAVGSGKKSEVKQREKTVKSEGSKR